MENQNQNPQSAPPKKDLEVLWTVAQVAQYLLVQRGTVYNWLSQGQIIDPKRVIRIGKKVRIPRSEVERIAGNIKSNLQQQ
jgi:excisionase family DNA binding protein